MIILFLSFFHPFAVLFLSVYYPFAEKSDREGTSLSSKIVATHTKIVGKNYANYGHRPANEFAAVLIESPYKTRCQFFSPTYRTYVHANGPTK